MFGLIFLYSGVILSLGTSTMAWYSVQANVNIDVESASITIKTPFQYHFYAYNGNGFNVTDPEPNNWTPGTGYKYTGSNEQIAALKSLTAGVPTNYTEINELVGGQTVSKSGNAQALTTVSGLWPGYSMSFAIKAEGLATGAGGDHPYLKVYQNDPSTASDDTTHINPGNGAEATVRRYRGNDTSTPIYFAEAVKISSWSGYDISHGTNGLTHAGIEAKNMTGTSINSDWWSGTGSIDLGHPLTQNDPNATTYTYWWFFTITFYDHSSTWYHYDLTDGSGYKHYTRYSGEGSTDGYNSSCYEGLEFKLGEMTLKND